MVFFNYSTMQMVAKIVYYGPGLCGKTTNLNFIYEKTSPKSRGEMVSLATETDRTLFFDLLPLDVGVIGGFKTKFQLYTVPGQVFYNATRKLVLKGVDGIVFVADSQVPMLEANQDAFENLHENLESLGLDASQIPIVFQYNKRDLPNITAVDVLNATMNPDGEPFVEASALYGDGVFETLKAISKSTLLRLKAKVLGDEFKKNKASVVEFKVQGAKSIKKEIEEEAREGQQAGEKSEQTVVTNDGDPAETAQISAATTESLPGLDASKVPEHVSFDDYEAPLEESEEEIEEFSSINFDQIELEDADDMEGEVTLDDTNPIEANESDEIESLELDSELEDIEFDADIPPEFDEHPTPEVIQGKESKPPPPPKPKKEDSPLEALSTLEKAASQPSSKHHHVKTKSVDDLLSGLVSDVKGKKKKVEKHHIKVANGFTQAQVNCVFLDNAGNVVHSKLLKVAPHRLESGRYEIRLNLQIEET